MNSKDYQAIFSSFSNKKIFYNYPLKDFSSFHSGGAADVLLLPSNIEEIKAAMSLCKQNEIPVQVLGKGSNVLISDKGIRGLTIYLHSNFDQIQIKDNLIYANVGTSLAQLAALAASNNLSGLEFAAGIPGSLGGAILMNASAYDGEIKNVVENSSYLNEENEIKELNKEDHQFDYRHSFYSDKPYIILRAELKLQKGKRLEIYEKMNEFQIKRRQSQPLDKYSGGSAFKRPTGYFAGKLISDAGLKGYSTQNAGVSAKHAGFVVNYGEATASEINSVFRHVKEEVKKQFGIDLHPEVKWLGEGDAEEIAWKL